MLELHTEGGVYRFTAVLNPHVYRWPGLQVYSQVHRVCSQVYRVYNTFYKVYNKVYRVYSKVYRVYTKCKHEGSVQVCMGLQVYPQPSGCTQH